MMADGSVETVPWESANDSLREYIGISLFCLNKLNSIPKDHYVFLDRIDEWEELSDLDILKDARCVNEMSGFIYIITDLSYRKDVGVFKVLFHELAIFIEKYRNKYKECFFNGDVIFICPKKNIFLMFQHDGYFISYTLPLILNSGAE